jgi:UTP:GlnB (protein PII) uridylyltransferase
LQAPGLADTAGERIFAELALILSSEAVLGGLSLMSEFGLMAQVLPEVSSLKDVEQNRYHHLDVYEHTLLVLEQVMRLQHDPAAVLGGVDQRCIERISGLLGERLADDLTRGTALRFGALLHDVAKPQTQARGADGTVLGFPDHAAQGAALVTEICARMRTSDRLSKYLAALTRHHLGLGFLVHADPLDARAVYRYLAATAPEQVDVSLLSIADRLATLGHKAEVSTLRHLEVARRVLPDALQFDAFLAQAPLVRGDVLAAELGLAPGPELGAMLEAITEARFAGEVSSEADAIAYARRL